VILEKENYLYGIPYTSGKKYVREIGRPLSTRIIEQVVSQPSLDLRSIWLPLLWE
jgi:hypothetical protein